MKKSVYRVVAAAAMVATLGLATACGGDDSSGKDKDKGGKGSDKATTAPPAASGAEPLTAAQLEKASLETKDGQGFAVTKMTDKEIAEGGSAKSDKAECQPVAALLGTDFDPAPVASTYRNYAMADAATASENPEAALLGMVRLSAHKPGDAEKVMTSVRDALKACGGGFTVTDGQGEKQVVTEAKEVLIPEAGDESLGLVLSNKNKEEGNVKFILVRSGAQVVTFFGFNMADPEQPEVPQVLVSTQVTKIEKAAKAKG
ncbi:hypothetical protein IHE55_11430 [Streptomyces pactum]|uniref:Lipoprotein n=1 Tax=Streptomyces pactum TaxID=68249 RepID=A0ABS0NJP0_9ACTN|nr:hypothetical protein [Streptomyces pactum]MBH5335373.1 hypothetical protein [Streptomyces pactum]